MPWVVELTRRVRTLERSNRQLVERCNRLTQNLATMVAAFKVIIEAGEQEAAEAEEDEAELRRLEQQLVTLLLRKQHQRWSGGTGGGVDGDGVDGGEIDDEAPSGGAVGVPPLYDGPAPPPAPAAATAADGQGA